MPEGIVIETAVIIERWNKRHGAEIGDDALNDLLAALTKVLIESESDITDGIAAIRAERMRQILSEGFTPDEDVVTHRGGQLASAALAYLMAHHKFDEAAAYWPWNPDTFKPVRGKNLVKAGALIAAELDRLRSI